jgi:hypothetical protein
MKFGLRRSLLTILLTVRFATVVQAYGPLGHEIVGAVADERLANTPTSTKLPWTEIDFPGDVTYANNIILTALQDRAVRL